MGSFREKTYQATKELRVEKALNATKVCLKAHRLLVKVHFSPLHNENASCMVLGCHYLRCDFNKQFD